jgi:hypothetical protein
MSLRPRAAEGRVDFWTPPCSSGTPLLGACLTRSPLRLGPLTRAFALSVARSLRQPFTEPYVIARRAWTAANSRAFEYIADALPRFSDHPHARPDELLQPRGRSLEARSRRRRSAADARYARQTNDVGPQCGARARPVPLSYWTVGKGGGKPRCIVRSACSEVFGFETKLVLAGEFKRLLRDEFAREPFTCSYAGRVAPHRANRAKSRPPPRRYL